MQYQPRVDLELFLERAALLRASKAAATIDDTSFTWQQGIDSEALVDVNGPDDEATTAFFVRVRDFGTPGKLIYVGKYIDLLGEMATGPRVAIVEHLRAALSDLGLVSHRWHEFVLGQSATPRDVWELWTYGFILHADEAKRAQYLALDGMVKSMARYVAYVYAGDLYYLVTVVEEMLRNTALDHRGVRMQFLATMPEFDHPGMSFKKALIRLERDVKAP